MKNNNTIEVHALGVVFKEEKLNCCRDGVTILRFFKGEDPLFVTVEFKVPIHMPHGKPIQKEWHVGFKRDEGTGLFEFYNSSSGYVPPPSA